MTDDAPTCGKGLAEHAPLPAALGDLTDAVARVLELHLPSLDLGDARGRREHEAYRILVDEHRAAARQLRATAERMAGYRDLPMGPHDVAALTAPENARAFERFVALERALADLLGTRLARDEAMLAEMRGGGDS